jgi:hypothetical protein
MSKDRVRELSGAAWYGDIKIMIFHRSNPKSRNISGQFVARITLLLGVIQSVIHLPILMAYGG